MKYRLQSVCGEMDLNAPDVVEALGFRAESRAWAEYLDIMRGAWKFWGRWR